MRGREEERDCGGRRGEAPPTLHQDWTICRLSDVARGQLLNSNSSSHDGVFKGNHSHYGDTIRPKESLQMLF